MDIYKIEKLPLRPLVYGLLILYMILDLALQGPLHERLTRYVAGSDAASRLAEDEGWVATVNGHPITIAQLDAAVDLHLARRGRTREDHNPQNLLIMQLSVLDHLINDELVRIWSTAQPVEVPEAYLEQRLTSWKESFLPEELNEVSVLHELTPALTKSYLREHARQQYWIESKIGDALVVTDEEIAEFHETWKDYLRTEPMTRARHIFLSTVETSSEVQEAKIRTVSERLRSGEAFVAVATEVSEDLHTKDSGGDLGWFTESRMPDLFMDSIRELKVGEPSEPFRSHLGWHIVQVDERRPAAQLSLEEAKAEITDHLQNQARATAVDAFTHQLRQPQRANVQFFEPARQLRTPSEG